MTRTLTPPSTKPKGETKQEQLDPENPNVIKFTALADWLHVEKERLSALTDEWNAKHEEALALMSELGVTEFDTGTHVVTYRQNSQDAVDWAGIEKTLDPAEWERVTKRVGDREKLIAAIDQKLISEGHIRKLKKFVTEKLTKPWLATKENKPTVKAPRRK